MKQSPVTMELQRLRRFKAKVAPDLSLHEDVTALYKNFAKQQKTVGELDDMWREIAPGEFADRATIQKIGSNGVLTIRVADSATQYEFDRWLRGGGLNHIKQRCRTEIKSIKIEL
ncbi:MAG: DUF721 domain-containing protein [Planctomycetes bacterium]|nr:DUF721 domain-containing protein [Planctomycetota bacterium]